MDAVTIIVQVVDTKAPKRELPRNLFTDKADAVARKRLKTDKK